MLLNTSETSLSIIFSISAVSNFLERYPSGKNTWSHLQSFSLHRYEMSTFLCCWSLEYLDAHSCTVKTLVRAINYVEKQRNPTAGRFQCICSMFVSPADKCPLRFAALIIPFKLRVWTTGPQAVFRREMHNVVEIGSPSELFLFRADGRNTGQYYSRGRGRGARQRVWPVSESNSSKPVDRR